MTNARTFLKSLVPPILARPLAKLWPSSELPVLQFHAPNWLESPLAGANGWNVETVVDAETAKWEAFKNNLTEPGPLGFSHESTDLTITRNLFFHNVHVSYGYVLALAAQRQSTVSVLDWGGGLGHYYLLGKALLPGVHLDFSCRDVPLMCQRGRQLCPEVHFYDDDSCLTRSYDLVLVNGSLGYLQNWQSIVESLSRAAGNYLFLTRVLTVRNSSSFIALQRTRVYNYNSDMLTQVFNETELLDVVAQTGLRLVREFVVGDGPTIAGAPEQCRDCGWLFKRDENGSRQGR
jgi:putative methyltransferase (TIGR04325 family)